MVKPQYEYRVILKPSIDRLLAAKKILIDTPTMSEFLGVPTKQVYRLMGTDRIPLPIRLGLGRARRWSTYELLEWVEAGCPGRGRWIEQRGWSGYVRRFGHDLLW